MCLAGRVRAEAGEGRRPPQDWNECLRTVCSFAVANVNGQ